MFESYQQSMKRLLERYAKLYVAKSRHHAILDRTQAADLHPIELLYGVGGHDVLVTAPLDRIRFQSQHGFAACPESRSPFVRTMRDYLEGQCMTYTGSCLEHFYNTWQPSSPAEYLQLHDPVGHWLKTDSPLAAISPWSTSTPDEQFQAIQSAMAEENAASGLSGSLVVQGYNHFGSVARKKGKVEFARLVRVTESIRKNGLLVDSAGFDNLQCYLLLDRDDYRFRISQGHHRIAALVALGYKSTTLQLEFRNTIRRSEAGWWPAVRQGWFTREEAITVFDRIFEGK